jgi:glycosyltransferase involved in cell wall biosynthesis
VREQVSVQLTVLIPCKDEARNIRACIESVRSLADEILVADSGSTDGTLDIVRQIGGCRIIQREFVGYASFKNWAIPQATHPWVLIVDADERMRRPLADEIRRVVQNAADDVDGYWIPFRCFFMGHPLRFSGWNTPACRLIRRDRCRYRQRSVHEEIEIDPSRTGQLRGHLDHYSFWSYDEYFAKYVRYTKLGADELWRQGRRAGFVGLLLRPWLRFLQLYLLKGGFLDGLAGLQVCMLTAFFNTFVKQARLWELQHARPAPDAGESPSVPPAQPRSAA